MIENELKIAVVIAYFTPVGKGLPNYFEYWQKSAGANKSIDFYVATNVDVSNYDKYANIHFLTMSVESFWDQVQQLLGCKIVKDYYKIAELKPLYGILFQDVLKNYDYWGYGDIDLIYGDIIKILRPYLEAGKDVIGNFGHFCILKNTDKIRQLPLKNAMFIKHPLNIRDIASTKFCFYWDEFRGMGVRLYQAGIDVVRLQNIIADIDQKYKYFSILNRPAKWGFAWKDGALTGYNNLNEKIEFLYAHFQKRALNTPVGKVSNQFCIVPNKILNGCDYSNHILVGSVIYTAINRFKYHKKTRHDLKTLSPELKLAFEETSQYCRENGLTPHRDELSFLKKLKSLF